MNYLTLQRMFTKIAFYAKRVKYVSEVSENCLEERNNPGSILLGILILRLW